MSFAAAHTTEREAVIDRRELEKAAWFMGWGGRILTAYMGTSCIQRGFAASSLPISVIGNIPKGNSQPTQCSPSSEIISLTSWRRQRSRTQVSAAPTPAARLSNHALKHAAAAALASSVGHGSTPKTIASSYAVTDRGESFGRASHLSIGAVRAVGLRGHKKLNARIDMLGARIDGFFNPNYVVAWFWSA